MVRSSNKSLKDKSSTSSSWSLASDPPPPPSDSLSAISQSIGSRIDWNVDFEYSNCTGNKKAVLVACTDVGYTPKWRIKELDELTNFLIEERGYSALNIHRFYNAREDPRFAPTRHGILAAIQWLVKDPKTNDSIFFYFAGNGTEDAIFAEDSGVYGGITHKTQLIDTLPKCCRLTVLLDVPSSGGFQLPDYWVWQSYATKPEELQNKLENMSDLYDDEKLDPKNVVNGLRRLDNGSITNSFKEGSHGYVQFAHKFTLHAAVVIDSCMDPKPAYKMRRSPPKCSPMLNVFIEVMKRNLEITHGELLEQMAAKLQQDLFIERPRFFSCHLFDHKRPFKF